MAAWSVSTNSDAIFRSPWWCRTIPRPPSFITTQTNGRLYCTAVDSAWTDIMKPPSPVTDTTGWSGRASFRPSAAGSDQPMPANPPGQKNVLLRCDW